VIGTPVHFKRPAKRQFLPQCRRPCHVQQHPSGTCAEQENTCLKFAASLAVTAKCVHLHAHLCMRLGLWRTSWGRNAVLNMATWHTLRKQLPVPCSQPVRKRPPAPQPTLPRQSLTRSNSPPRRTPCTCGTSRTVSIRKEAPSRLCTHRRSTPTYSGLLSPASARAARSLHNLQKGCGCPLAYF